MNLCRYASIAALMFASAAYAQSARDVRAALGLAASALQAGQDIEARETAEALLDQLPQNDAATIAAKIEAYLIIARAESELGKDRAAAGVLRKAVKAVDAAYSDQPAKRADGLMAIVRFQLKCADARGANKVIKRAKSLYAQAGNKLKAVEADYWMARYHMARGRLKTANKALEAVLTEIDRDPQLASLAFKVRTTAVTNAKYMRDNKLLDKHVTALNTLTSGGKDAPPRSLTRLVVPVTETIPDEAFVSFALDLDSGGKPTRARILDSNVDGEIVAMARSAVLRHQFLPAIKEGQAVTATGFEYRVTIDRAPRRAPGGNATPIGGRGPN